MAFTETWLTPEDLNTDLTLTGFGVPVRLDRDAVVTLKSQRGGVCLYVNQQWYKKFTVRGTVCTEDIELWSVSLWPHYLPCEFPQIFLTVAYIHPKANAKKCCNNHTKRYTKAPVPLSRCSLLCPW